MIARILIIMFVGALIGTVVWQAARYVSLPVLSAADSEGHGPDRGPEWDSVIQHATRQKEQRSVVLGVVTAVVSVVLLSYAAIR